MRKLIVLAGLLLLASAAHAQCPFAARSSSASSASHGSLSASGSANYVPSTFENYAEALGTGEKELSAKVPQVAEAARIAQAKKKSASQKPVLVAKQDEGGNLIITRPGQTGKKNQGSD